jgi:hypothetical protein
MRTGNESRHCTHSPRGPNISSSPLAGLLKKAKEKQRNKTEATEVTEYDLSLGSFFSSLLENIYRLSILHLTIINK